MKSLLSIKNLIIKEVKRNWLIYLIVFVSLFLRLFKISSYMTYLGDEGRDSLVWLRMIRNGKMTLIGPQTSIGNMYLGPLFYYLMAPFFAILGTAGPSIETALFAGATTFLLWYYGKKWFSPIVGITSALFYAISPTAIILSRSAWNPNIMPLLSLLTVIGIWEFYKNNNYKWIAVIGILLSFVIQSHYLGLLLVPVAGLFWIIKLYSLKKSNKPINNLIKYSLCSLGLFVILTILPLLWFDLRHNFLNYKSFYKFFSERQTTVNFKPYKAIPQMWPLWTNLVTRLVSGQNIIFGKIMSFVLLPSFIYVLLKKKFEYSLIVVVLFMGILGMGLYKQHIYDHYFGFLYPFIFIILGLLFEFLKSFKNKFISVYMNYLLIIVTFVFSVINCPLLNKPNNQMNRTKEISEKIILESNNQPFNLGMIAKQNYDAGYRYFLEKSGHKAVEIDAQKVDETITEQLFVVCEIEECKPTTHPQAEIANFGWSKIEKEWDFPWGAKLFLLKHNK